MPTPDPILAQRVMDLQGRLTVIDSLLPQVSDRTLRSSLQLEVVQLKQMVQDLLS